MQMHVRDIGEVSSQRDPVLYVFSWPIHSDAVCSFFRCWTS